MAGSWAGVCGSQPPAHRRGSPATLLVLLQPSQPSMTGPGRALAPLLVLCVMTSVRCGAQRRQQALASCTIASCTIVQPVPCGARRPEVAALLPHARRASCEPKDQNDALARTNELRARHGSPPLEWDDTLAAQAQEWTDTCVWKHSDTMGQQKGWASYGENLASAGAAVPPPLGS